MPNQSGKIVLVLVLVLLIVGAAFYFFSPSLKKQDYDSNEQTPGLIPQPTPNVQQASESPNMTAEFYSTNLKISIRLPEGSDIQEKFTDLNINLPEGKIQIRRIGTNFGDIKSYFENLKVKNKMTLLSEKSVKVNNYEALLITMTDPNNDSKTLMEYMLLNNNFVYKFTTSDEPLYSTLNQIVQSFEYKP